MDDLRARKASEIIGTILSPDVAAKAGSWSRFFGSWERAAGERLSAHSRPVDVRNGIVIVEADHPGWVQLLQLDQKRILDAIKRSFPELEITGIAFKTAKDRSVYLPPDRNAGSGFR
jgi:predicted nucleic acid-binding Zn ribbon protein